MQLTLHTDYALRVLVYLSIHPDKIVTIDQVTDFYEISRNHLVKVVHNLSSKGFITTTRGKHGGMQLARPPQDISIGEVVRKIEPNFDMVECFNPNNKICRIVPICELKTVLQQATNNFLLFLDQYTLADAINTESDISVFVSNATN